MAMASRPVCGPSGIDIPKAANISVGHLAVDFIVFGQQDRAARHYRGRVAAAPPTPGRGLPGPGGRPPLAAFMMASSKSGLTRRLGKKPRRNRLRTSYRSHSAARKLLKRTKADVFFNSRSFFLWPPPIPIPSMPGNPPIEHRHMESLSLGGTAVLSFLQGFGAIGCLLHFSVPSGDGFAIDFRG
jgi:hypothetical protein